MYSVSEGTSSGAVGEVVAAAGAATVGSVALESIMPSITSVGGTGGASTDILSSAVTVRLWESFRRRFGSQTSPLIPHLRVFPHVFLNC